MLLCGALTCGEKSIAKLYEIVGGCPRLYLQTRMPILPWMMKVRNQEWKTQQINLHLNSSWILEVQKSLLLKNMCNWQGRKLLMQSTTWLSGRFGMRLRSPLGLDLNEESMEGNCMGNQPTPIVKLPHTREYAQLLSNFAMQHPMKFWIVDVMNMQYFMNKLNKMPISSIIKRQ